MALVQVINGAFQSNIGGPLSNGWLTCLLSHDATATTNAQVVGGIRTKIFLDNNGNVAGLQYLWANASVLPASTFYIVEAYNNKGLRVWRAPQYWTIPTTGPVDLGTLTSSNP